LRKKEKEGKRRPKVLARDPYSSGCKLLKKTVEKKKGQKIAH